MQDDILNDSMNSVDTVLGALQENGLNHNNLLHYDNKHGTLYKSYTNGKKDENAKIEFDGINNGKYIIFDEDHSHFIALKIEDNNATFLDSQGSTVFQLKEYDQGLEVDKEVKEQFEAAGQDPTKNLEEPSDYKNIVDLFKEKNKDKNITLYSPEHKHKEKVSFNQDSSIKHESHPAQFLDHCAAECLVFLFGNKPKLPNNFFFENLKKQIMATVKKNLECQAPERIQGSDLYKYYDEYQKEIGDAKKKKPVIKSTPGAGWNIFRPVEAINVSVKDKLGDPFDRISPKEKLIDYLDIGEESKHDDIKMAYVKELEKLKEGLRKYPQGNDFIYDKDSELIKAMARLKKSETGFSKKIKNLYTRNEYGDFKRLATDEDFDAKLKKIRYRNASATLKGNYQKFKEGRNHKDYKYELLSVFERNKLTFWNKSPVLGQDQSIRITRKSQKTSRQDFINHVIEMAVASNNPNVTFNFELNSDEVAKINKKFKKVDLQISDNIGTIKSSSERTSSMNLTRPRSKSCSSPYNYKNVDLQISDKLDTSKTSPERKSSMNRTRSRRNSCPSPASQLNGANNAIQRATGPRNN